MNAFVTRHSDIVTGVLTGLDRLVLRGTLRQIAYASGLDKCLGVEGVLLKEFGKFAERMTDRLVERTEFRTTKLGRPLVYLPSSKVEKEDCALSIAKRDGITRGLICVLKSVEPCQTFDIRKDRSTGHIELVSKERKCSFFYHYMFHPRFGFMNARIQSWLPFTIQLCVNGREMLARQMDRVGLSYERADNTFTSLEDPVRAQQLMNRQLTWDLAKELERLARVLCPAYPRLFTRFEVPYHWTVYQSEVATDVMFREVSDLQRLYRPLVKTAISVFGSADVIRFLGQRNVNADGAIRADFDGEVTSDYKHRPEGVRVKHAVNANSVKVYDKAGSVLRTETTINDPREFRVMRPKEGGKPKDMKRRYLRRSIEDLQRRVETSAECNTRYLDALGAIDVARPLSELTRDLAQPAMVGKARARGLNPHRPDDAQLLRAVNRADFVLNGFRNADIRSQLHPSTDDAVLLRRQVGNVARRIRLLRVHGLLERQAGTHRYQVTPAGREIMTAVLNALDADPRRLVSAA